MKKLKDYIKAIKDVKVNTRIDFLLKNHATLSALFDRKL